MKRIVFHFDVVSPFAYLAFERLPQVLQGCSYEVEYRPVLFAGLLQHWGQKGPAEIEPKRAWTFRHVHWLAQQHGIDAGHAGACTRSTRCRCCAWRWPAGPTGASWRRCSATPGWAATTRTMRSAWPNSPPGWRRARDPAGDEVKAELRRLTDDAVARPASSACRRSTLRRPPLLGPGRAADAARRAAGRRLVRRPGLGPRRRAARRRRARLNRGRSRRAAHALQARCRVSAHVGPASEQGQRMAQRSGAR